MTGVKLKEPTSPDIENKKDQACLRDLSTNKLKTVSIQRFNERKRTLKSCNANDIYTHNIVEKMSREAEDFQYKNLLQI